ncbi:HNH endonuclease [Cognatishimia sp. F0-27]|uniref:HNH endonuclease n=1 Tax=Cognatishimia sp. F0-27 TaxID=2816855 RepID=UPI001D0C994D|nr:HNH endonuclease signature motif containing protein [Cognatishimia sp. F0-27]MCC1495129.1 HNH endonuclease [Cognatishimia sp. F0-27]
MVANLDELKPKDPTRSFGDTIRRILFFEQEKLCAVCMKEVAFDDMEVHHITPHSQGGKTSLNNGAIVHKACHPKSEQEVSAFYEKWRLRKSYLHQKKMQDRGFSQPPEAGTDYEQDGVVIPHGTPAKMEYQNGEQVYEGRFEDGVLMVNGLAYSSLSSAANALAVTKNGKKTNLNGWLYWKVLLPGDDHWTPVRSLRDRAESKDQE